MEINIGQHILSAHNEITIKNKDLLRQYGILAINLMGSPGAGKTSVLEQLIGRLKPHVRMAVIEGDLYTSKDADRIEAQGIPVVQINTRGACHLDGKMIAEALQQLPLGEIDLLIIENIGNLVCPAEFDLGEDFRISVLSVTEGEDKVPKYPLMFKGVAGVILNKVDLLPYTAFDTGAFYKDLQLLNPDAVVFEVSCRLNTGLDELAAWLQEQIDHRGKKEE